jgi:hypothetical protein
MVNVDDESTDIMIFDGEEEIIQNDDNI